MSFILDALKKSESDRQRQSGPALFEVKVAPPRAGLPAWAIGVLVLLVVNLGILGWVLLHRTPAPSASVSAAAAPTAAASPPRPAASPAGVSAPAATSATAAPAPAAPLSTNPAAAGPAAAAAQGIPASPPEAARTATGPEAAASSSATAPGGEDEAPAIEATPAEPFRSRVRNTTSAGLPLYPDAAAAQASGMPMLRLDLHVFAARPPERFVLINMHRLREGDVLPEGGGVRVESITSDGAVLERNGTRYLLPRE